MSLDASEQKLVRDVSEYGWHVVQVSSAADESDEPPFAYTVGLEATFGWPELLCYGLDLPTMGALLNNAVEELRTRGIVPVEGLMLHEVVTSFDCRLAPVAKRHNQEHLGFAMWFARYRESKSAEVRCLQLLWPDHDGRYPNEDGCSPEVKEMQPMLAD